MQYLQNCGALTLSMRDLVRTLWGVCESGRNPNPNPKFLLLYKKIAILCVHKKHAFLYIDKAFSYNYKGISKIGVIHKKWCPNAKYQYKVDFLPKPWNDSMVHAVILVVHFCSKHTRKVTCSRKHVFDQNHKFEHTWNPDKTCPISTL